jgi:hypothetical protein
MIESPRPAIDPQAVSPDVCDRREDERRPTERWLDLIVLDAEGEPTDSVRLPTFNISRGGAGLLADRSLHAGTTVLLRVSASDGEDAVRRTGVVRHCTPAGIAGFFSIGVEYTNDSSLLARFDQGLHDERPRDADQ